MTDINSKIAAKLESKNLKISELEKKLSNFTNNWLLIKLYYIFSWFIGKNIAQSIKTVVLFIDYNYLNNTLLIIISSLLLMIEILSIQSKAY